MPHLIVFDISVQFHTHLIVFDISVQSCTNLTVLEKLWSFVDTLGYNAIRHQVLWGLYSNRDINSGCYNI